MADLDPKLDPARALARADAEPAAKSDVDEIHALILSLASWFGARGVSQWSSDYPREKIAADVDANFVYLVRSGGRVAATVTLTDRPDSYWSDFPGEAVYLHRLAVDRACAGARLGARLVEWSMAEVRRRRSPRLRLDCRAENPRMRAYYAALGFEFRGVRRGTESGLDYALFEMET